MVFWDYRIPHANSYKNNSHQTREVIYTGLLPNITLNKQYISEQLDKYFTGINPTDQWVSDSKDTQKCDYVFSELGRKMMGIDSWSSR